MKKAPHVYFFSGPVHSGKTTRLIKWSQSRSSLDGIVAPLINGQRYLRHLVSGEQRLLQLPEAGDNKNADRIGAYRFSREAFNWAQQKLQTACKNELQWLIVDEVGPLELTGKGLEPALNRIINGRAGCFENIVLVVRETLTDRVIEHYGFLKEAVRFLSLP